MPSSTVDTPKRIATICKVIYDDRRGVFMPIVCKFCFGCPIGFIAHPGQTEASEIPTEHLPEINAWLDTFPQ